MGLCVHRRGRRPRREPPKACILTFGEPLRRPANQHVNKMKNDKLMSIDTIRCSRGVACRSRPSAQELSFFIVIKSCVGFLFRNTGAASYSPTAKLSFIVRLSKKIRFGSYSDVRVAEDVDPYGVHINPPINLNLTFAFYSSVSYLKKS